MRVHVAQVVGARTGEARHRVQLQGEHGLIINQRVLHYLAFLYVPCPAGSVSQGRLAALGGQEFRYLRQFEGQFALVDQARHPVLVVDGERLAPIALAAEDSVAQAVVHLHPSQVVLGDVFLRGGYRLFYSQTVEVQFAIRCHTCSRRVAYDALLGVEALLAHVTTFHQWHDRQAEMFGESVVAAIVRRHRHNSARAIARQYVITHPDRHRLARERVHGVRAGKHTRHLAVSDALALGPFFRTLQVSLHLDPLGLGRHLRYQLAFRRQHHEGDAKHRIRPGSEDGKLYVAIFYPEAYLRTFRATYPVALCLLQ